MVCFSLDDCFFEMIPNPLLEIPFSPDKTQHRQLIDHSPHQSMFHEGIDSAVFKHAFQIPFMANPILLLQERLQRVETRTRGILEATVQDVQLPATTEVWWPHLVAFFGNETALFETVGIERDLFDNALALTAETPQQSRGKQGSLRTNREKLLFLMIFMRKGVEVLELLVVNFIKTREHIVERAKTIARLFYSNLVEGAVRFFGETVAEAPDAALIVDCTACQIRRPKRPFDEAKVFF